jgi:Tfp pilus assembly protein PilF
LIDTLEGGGHLWEERFDRELADIFAVQDELVARIVEALVGKLAVSKLIERKPPARLEAYDLCVRGRFLYHRMEAKGGKEARQLFQQTIAIDPNYAEAHAYLAMTHWLGWTNWQEPVNPNRQLALQHARRGVALDPNDPFAHLVLGFVLGYEHQYEESAAEVETALRLDPNHAYTYAQRADLLVMDGRPLEAITSVGQALRLDPHPPPWYYWAKGEAEYAARQYESAVATLRHSQLTARRRVRFLLRRWRSSGDTKKAAWKVVCSWPTFRSSG